MKKIANYLKKGFAIEYISKYRSSPVIDFSTQKKWPAILVQKNSDEDYTVYTFNTVANAMKILMKNLKQYWPDLFGKKFSDYLSYLTGYENFEDISPGDQKRYEKSIKKYLMSSIEIKKKYGRLLDLNKTEEAVILDKKEKMNRLQLYKFLVLKHKLQPQDFTEYYGAIEIDVNDNNIVKHKLWEVHFDNSIKIDPKFVIQFLDKVESTLKPKKMGMLAYGKVYIVDRLGGKALADYMFSNDYIRLGQRFKSSELKNFIHELGHRLHDRFLSKEQRDAVADKYKTMIKNQPKAKVGDKIFDKTLESIYEVKSTKYSRRQLYLIVELIEKGAKDKRGKLGGKYDLPEYAIGSGYELISKGDNDYSAFFPTSYSTTKTEEFFSELFAYYMLNQLKEPAKTWFGEIIK